MIDDMIYKFIAVFCPLHPFMPFVLFNGHPFDTAQRVSVLFSALVIIHAFLIKIKCFVVVVYSCVCLNIGVYCRLVENLF